MCGRQIHCMQHNIFPFAVSAHRVFFSRSRASLLVLLILAFRRFVRAFECVPCIVATASSSHYKAWKTLRHAMHLSSIFSHCFFTAGRCISLLENLFDDIYTANRFPPLHFTANVCEHRSDHILDRWKRGIFHWSYVGECRRKKPLMSSSRCYAHEFRWLTTIRQILLRRLHFCCTQFHTYWAI